MEGTGCPSRSYRRHPAWISRWRARARQSKGIALLEAAFATPIFMMLVLGVAEGGLFMKDYLAVANAARAGARSASAAGADAEADLYTLLDVVKEISGIPQSQIDYIVIYKATGFGAGPTDDSGPGTGCLSGVPVTGKCNVYRPADFAKARADADERAAQETAEEAGTPRTLDESKLWFGCRTTGPNANKSLDRYWCPKDRKVARSDNNRQGPDYVGVWIKARHSWVTKMFGSNKTITDQSVIQIEPRVEEATS